MQAAAEWIGRGQIAAGISNMSNLTKIIGPFSYTVLFGTYGQSSPFWAAGAFIVASEILLRMRKGMGFASLQKAQETMKGGKAATATL